MDKRSFMGLGYAAEKLLEHYTKAPPKVDINSPDSINDFISGAPTPFSNNQLLLAPLLGAGAGGLAGLAFGNPKARKRDMLVGALGGGMIGGGAALGYKYLGGAAADKARELNTVPADYVQQNQDNIKLLEDHQKSWNPLKGGLIEVNTGRPIANTEIPIRIEKLKKLRELYPQIPEAAGNYEQHRRGITGGLQGGVAGLTLAKILDTIVPYNAAKKPKPKKDKKDMDAKTQKKADSTAAIMGGLGGLVPGGIAGAGAGGLYGLVSGAYQAEKGKKLRGALTGLGRGVVGGGLIGGGIGAGAGAGAGLTLPRGLFSPFGATLGGLQIAADPIGTASRAALGGVGGAALGGYLGNKARKSTLGEPKKDEEKPEEKSEKKDTKPEAQEERKAAGVKQADLYGAYLGGSNLGTVGALGGAGLGGLYGLASGAYQAPKGKKLQGALRGAGRGAVGGGLLGGGTGLGMGAAMGSQIPFSDMINAAKMKDSPERDAARQALRERLSKINPEMFAGLTTAGTLGGAALGGYLGDKVLNDKKDEDEKEAELKLSPLAGMKKPKNDKGTSLNQVLEEARKKREANEKKQPAQKTASALLEALKEAASTPEYRKAHKAQNRARYAALLKADGGRSRSFTGANPALLDAHHYKYVKDRWAADKEDQKWDAADGGNRHAKTIERANAKPEQTKASAYEFGRMIKRSDLMSGLQSVGDYAKGLWNSPGVQSFVNDPTTRAGLTYGGIGAGLGGLYGLINPGEYEDETGNVRRRGRLSGALRGALGGGALGGLAGAGAQEGRFQYLKHLMNQRAGFPNAMGGLDRSEALDNAEAFARNNPSAVGALGTSPLQSATNAYSAATDAVKGFMPKQMGKAPATGVETPAKPPEVKTTDEQR